MLLEKQKAPFGASAILNFSGLVVRRRRSLALASCCRTDSRCSGSCAERRSADRHAGRTNRRTRAASHATGSATSRTCGSTRSTAGTSRATSAASLSDLHAAGWPSRLCDGNRRDCDRHDCKSEMNALHDPSPFVVLVLPTSTPDTLNVNRGRDNTHN